MQKFDDENIVLIEDVHEYKLLDRPEVRFTSATTFVKYFFRPFDKIGIANNLTTTHERYKHLTPQELVAKWNVIAEEGTAVHNEIENFIKNSDNPTMPKSKKAVEWIRSISPDRYEFFSEIIVYSEELGIAGSIDILIHDKKSNTYKLLDWKTNKKIETTSFANKMGTHPATSNLMDCNFIHYSLQLSVYRYILEKHYGIEISGSAIAHLTDEKVTLLKTNYYKDVLEEMLKADKGILENNFTELLTQEYV